MKAIRTESREVLIFACPHCGKECRGGGGLSAHICAVHDGKPRGFAKMIRELKELREFKAQSNNAQEENEEPKPLF